MDESNSGRPDLSLYGIEEIDRGICEDTIENRARLRAHDVEWRLDYDSDGVITGNLEALSLGMRVDGVLHHLNYREALLVDSKQPNSDYLTGLDLIMNDDALAVSPAWVVMQTRDFLALERRREENPGKEISPHIKAPPGRCVRIKTDGLRCLMWNTGKYDEQFCRLHSANSSRRSEVQAMVLKARERIQQASISATDTLESMLKAESEAVRLKAATEILDRAGIRGGVEIDQNVHVEVRPAGEILSERLTRLREGAERMQQIEAANTEDAEVVEDDE